MNPNKATGLTRLAKGVVYSWRGFVACFKSEAAFRQELALAVVLCPLGVWLGDTGAERALLVGSVALVLIVELLNTGIEYVVNRFGGEEIHELSGKAKDIAAAAVFLSLCNVVVVWALVLW